jgi:hypothetical protein
MDRETLIHVDAPHFCAGFVSRDGVVISAAPILKYLIGKRFVEAMAYLERKGWRASVFEFQPYDPSRRI